jgi:hypothetical protein
MGEMAASHSVQLQTQSVSVLAERQGRVFQHQPALSRHVWQERGRNQEFVACTQLHGKTHDSSHKLHGTMINSTLLPLPAPTTGTSLRLMFKLKQRLELSQTT